jgi:hypothetical protein
MFAEDVDAEQLFDVAGPLMYWLDLETQTCFSFGVPVPGMFRRSTLKMVVAVYSQDMAPHASFHMPCTVCAVETCRPVQLAAPSAGLVISGYQDDGVPTWCAGLHAWWPVLKDTTQVRLATEQAKKHVAQLETDFLQHWRETDDALLKPLVRAIDLAVHSVAFM